MSNDFVRWMPDRSGLGDAHVVPGSTVDPLLLGGLLLIIGYGLLVLYSAIDRDAVIFQAQAVRIGIALVVMVVAAYISPLFYLRWAPLIYCSGLVLLLLVLVGGVCKGCAALARNTWWTPLPTQRVDEDCRAAYGGVVSA